MRLRWMGGLCAALVGMALAPSARASSGIDSPENGVVQVGRGGAWVARADDPLAVYFNPAGIARQPTGIHVGAHILLMKRCFTRLGADGLPVSPGNNLPGPGAEGGPAAEVCKETSPFPNPQGAATIRLTDELAIGLSVMGPHGVGKSSWPETLTYINKFGVETQQPAPQRYMLLEADSTILLPTISAAYSITDQLSVGAGFIWGVALIKFLNFTEGVSPASEAGEIPSDNYDSHVDVQAQIAAKDLFIPGFVIGGLWSPTPRFDVGVWLKWTDAVRSKVDLHAESLYWTPGGQKNDDPCQTKDDDPTNDDPGGPNCNITDAKEAGDLVFRIPMEAKIGMRYHHPRPGTAKPEWASRKEKRTIDPMTEDLFDVELDFTWAHNSVVKDLELAFKPGVAIAGTPSSAPLDSSVAHNWKDVIGVRLGGDFVAIPGRLALRAGGFFESQGQDDEYLNIDFHLGHRIGVGGGATVRVGPVDVSLAYQHTFFGALDNKGRGALKAISGDPGVKDDPESTPYRSRQAINGGRLETSLNEFGVAGTVRF